MPILETKTFQVVCDADGCLEESAATDTESGAKFYARQDGFVEGRGENEGRWFCPTCAAREEKTKKKGKAKR